MKLKKYQIGCIQIQKEELPTFQRYWNKLVEKTSFRVPQNVQHSDIVNRILSGEKVFKYKEGGNL